MKLNKLIKKVNKENAPPDGWRLEDKPEANKQYALTGGPGDKCANGALGQASSLTGLVVSYKFLRNRKI